MKSIFLKICIVFLPMVMMAQSPFESNVIAPLNKPQPFFEKVYVHTNKELYSKTDVLWFKVYVVSSDNKPSLHTTLVYVDLFDSDGELIETKNVFVNKGIGTGQFFLSEDLTGNKVYIRGHTNFMKNFGDGNVYSHRLNLLERPEKKERSPDILYDVQFFPEGGYFLEGVQNTMGIKALVNGRNVDYKGQVVDSKGEKIVDFSKVHFGMGKCSFTYIENERYKVIVQINDTTIQKTLPKAKKIGITLSIPDTDKNHVTIQLQTNQKSIETDSENYILLLHQRNQLIDYLPITLIDTNTIEIEAEKKLFFNGINTVTLFKNDQPIATRRFFVERPDDLKAEIDLQDIKKEQDSISYELSAIDSVTKRPIRSNLSVSVLSIDENYAYGHRASIQAAFLLTPYIKGHIERPFYYFNKSNNKRLEYLDLLLLTQGWMQYENSFEEFYPTTEHDFELGFHLKGEVSPVVSDSLVLLSNKGEIIDKISLKGKKEFDFKKLLIHRGDSVKIAFIENGADAIKPQTITMDTIVPESLPLEYQLFKGPNVSTIEQEHLSNFYEGYDNGNITRLEEVEVSEKQLSKRALERKRIINKYKSIVFDIGAYYNLDISDVHRSRDNDIFQFLQREGVILKNWNGIEWYLAVGNKEARLVLDGRAIESNELGSLLLRMSDVENVLVASTRGNRTYQVFTTDNYKKGIEELFQGYIIKNGYDKAFKYYTPIYDAIQITPIKEVDWKPNLLTNEKGKASFKIENSPLLNQIFLVKGISNKGHIIEELIFK